MTFRAAHEGAHVRALGTPHHGPDIPANMLCLCPNCHVQFDNGALLIHDDLSIVVNNRPVGKASHPLEPRHQPSAFRLPPLSAPLALPYQFQATRRSGPLSRRHHLKRRPSMYTGSSTCHINHEPLQAPRRVSSSRSDCHHATLGRRANPASGARARAQRPDPVANRRAILGAS